jgi:hypothetical protein
VTSAHSTNHAVYNPQALKSSALLQHCERNNFAKENSFPNTDRPLSAEESRTGIHTVVISTVHHRCGLSVADFQNGWCCWNAVIAASLAEPFPRYAVSEFVFNKSSTLSMDLNQEPLPSPTFHAPANPHRQTSQQPSPLFTFPPVDLEEDLSFPPPGYNPEDFLEKSNVIDENSVRR